MTRHQSGEARNKYNRIVTVILYHREYVGTCSMTQYARKSHVRVGITSNPNLSRAPCTGDHRGRFAVSCHRENFAMRWTGRSHSTATAHRDASTQIHSSGSRDQDCRERQAARRYSQDILSTQFVRRAGSKGVIGHATGIADQCRALSATCTRAILMSPDQPEFNARQPPAKKRNCHLE